MHLPFGPESINLKFGSLYRMERISKEGYPNEVIDADIVIASAVLQIAHCTPGSWKYKKEEIEVFTVSGDMWDTYNVKYGVNIVYSLGEDIDGYILHYEIYNNCWTEIILKEAQSFAERFGKH